MRKNILLAVVFIVGSVISAFAAMPIPQNGQIPIYSYNPATGEEMMMAVKRTSSKVHAVEKKTDALAKRVQVTEQIQAQTQAVLVETNKNVDRLATATDKNTDAIVKVDKTVKAEAKGLSDQGFNNTLIIGGLIGLVGVILFVRSCMTRKETVAAVEPAVNRMKETAEKIETNVASVATTIGSAKDEILAAITASQEKVITEVHEVPAKTAGINELQRPFILTGIHGHDYQINPVMMDGKVRTLRIIADANEDDYDVVTKVPRTPATTLTSLKATNARVLALCLDPSLTHGHGHAALQKAVIDNAMGGEIVQIA